MEETRQEIEAEIKRLQEKLKDLGRPKTYQECVDKLDLGADLAFPGACVPVELREPFDALARLLICRDIYRDGWKPDYSNTMQYKHCLRVDMVVVVRHSSIFSFQSKKVLDDFSENFKHLIETATPLL